MCLKEMNTKGICKDMDDKIINELDLKHWFSMDEEQKETVKKIAAEFPYSIELVSGIYMEQKFSEEKTRDILMMRLGDYNGEQLYFKEKMDLNWIDPNKELPKDQQLCEIIVDFTFAVTGELNKEMKNITEASRFKAVYNENKTNWIIINGSIPSGYTYSKVIKWRPIIEEGEINANRN